MMLYLNRVRNDTMKWLTAIPVYNEAKHVRDVLAQVRRISPCVLVIDDGSTDGTPDILAEHPGLRVIRHESNRGYGAALRTAFDYFRSRRYDALVTMDCDGQHQPDRIPALLNALTEADIVSGSRYLEEHDTDTPAPGDRRFINRTITAELNDAYGLNLTDAFCGFKAYNRHALDAMNVTEPGYGMPLQVWVKAAKLGLKVREIAVPRVYLDPNRSFGAVLDDPARRLAYYRQVIADAA